MSAPNIKPGSAADRALRFLATVDHYGTGCGDVGAEVWPERTGRIAATGGGGDYAAQMMLGRLRRAGLVERAPSEGATRWRITAAGRRVIYPDGRLLRARDRA